MITVWRIALAGDAPPDADALAVLAPSEHARAAQFAFDGDRHRWLHAHVAIRRILGAALGVAPAALRFTTGPKGKPALAWPEGSGLEFNFSDSADLALLALSRDAPVGVDVEHRHRVSNLEGIAASHFAAEEREALLALPAADRVETFFRIWTRKEAYIKAIGIGLTFGLDRFAVTIEAAAPRFLHIDGSAEEARAWTLANVPTAGPYVAALATRRPEVALESRTWNG